MSNFLKTLKETDTSLFLFLNSKHSVFFDEVMYWFSHTYFWIPLYLVLLFLIYKQVRKDIWLLLIFIFLLIVFSDQLSVHAFKNVFLRYRPCHNLIIQSKVHLLKGYCGGTYGFISSHATNTFALAMFLFLFFKNKIKHFGIFIFLWATLVSYSRIYSGVHYPADIVVGAIVGMGIGSMLWSFYNFSKKIIFKEN